MPRCSVTRRSSSAMSPTSRCTVSTSSVLSRPIGLSAISGVMRPFIVPSTSSSMLASTLDLESASNVSPSSCLELGVEGAERAGERAVVLVEQAGGGAGDLVDRRGDPRLEPGLEVGERPLDHVDVDGDVGGPQRPRPHRQAPADRGDRVVGLGDDPHDLLVVLLELAQVDDPVGHEDPARREHRWLCTHSPPLLGSAPAPGVCTGGVTLMGIPCAARPRRRTGPRRPYDHRMLDHLSIQCADVGAATAFYDTVLAPLGGGRIMELRRR